MNKSVYRNYTDYFDALYRPDYELDENESLIRCVTFIVTDACQLRCTYCYEGNKCEHFMTTGTAKKGVDLLFKMYEQNNHPFINNKTKGLVIDFMGGEPLLNIDIINFITEYFMSKAIQLHHPWAETVRFSISTNGQAYFDDKVQAYLRKWHNWISLNVSIDGPKYVHDACRIYPDGRGSFEIAEKAIDHYVRNYSGSFPSKATISQQNLPYMLDIVKFFYNKGCELLHINTVFEAEWTVEDAKLFYLELKDVADFMLEHSDFEVAFFDDQYFKPLPEDDIQCWCGGSGKMLAFDYDGTAYPCTRFAPASLGDSCKPLTVGNVDEVFTTLEAQNTYKCLTCITRRTKNTDDCFYCPIASGCADCEAWNYQWAGGVLDKRCINICIMHKARSLANVYYWNKHYKQTNKQKHFKMYLPKEEALKIIDEDEYNELLRLSEED